jgi:alkylation response protein AidB-like acyl-CoA dehydrogenase
MGMLLKAYVDEMGLGVANHAVSIFGGLGTADDDVPIQKYLRDVYTFLHGFATTEVALLIGAPTA